MIELKKCEIKKDENGKQYFVVEFVNEKNEVQNEVLPVKVIAKIKEEILEEIDNVFK